MDLVLIESPLDGHEERVGIVFSISEVVGAHAHGKELLTRWKHRRSGSSAPMVPIASTSIV